MKALLCSLLCIALVSCDSATVRKAPPTVGHELAPGVTLISGGFDPGHEPDGNSVVWTAPRGLVVMDTGRHPAHMQRIVEYAAHSRLPIVAVVNSHWHLDHVSGNARLRAAYPQLQVFAGPGMQAALSGFLAHSRLQSLEHLSTPGDPLEAAEMRADVATIDSGAALLPDVSITASADRSFAGRSLHVGFEAFAVTEGDVWLYDPATHILAAGDLVTLPAPFFDTACPQHWQSALQRLQNIDFKLLVPGHGEPLSKQRFQLYRVAFDSLLLCAASGADKTDCAAGWRRDAAVLLSGEQERRLADALINYYVDAILRSDRASACGDTHSSTTK